MFKHRYNIVDLKAVSIIRDKEGHYIITKGSVHKKDNIF